MSDIKRQSPTGFVIFCDDLRQEIDGKAIIIGAYTAGQMTLFANSLPAIIPKFCMLINVAFCRTEIDIPFEIQVFMPWDGDDSPSIQFGPNAPMTLNDHVKDTISDDPDVMIGTLIPVILSPFTVASEGRIRVFVVRGEDRYRIGSILLKRQEIPQNLSPTQKPQKS